MYRILLGAILLLVVIVWVVAGNRPADPEEGFQRAEEILQSRFADYRGRAERAVARMVRLAGETEPRALFRSAQKILEAEGVDGVAILDRESRARCWAGRTFQLDPRYDLHGVWNGYDAVEVLDHPAHRVLVAARPAGKEIAVAFYVFDETFPKRRDLAAEVKEAAGLAEVELRYSMLVPLGDGPGEGRKHKSFVIDQLVHATLWSKSDAEHEAEAAEAAATRNRMLGTLLAAFAAFLLWTRLGRRLPPTALLRTSLAIVLLAGVRTVVSRELWNRPLDVLVTASVTLGAALLLHRAARHPRARRTAWALALGSAAALFFLPRVYDALLRWIVDRTDDVLLFDALHVVPGTGAAMLLAGVCLLTLSAFVLADAARRWGRAAHRHLGWLPYVAIAAGLLPWKGALLAAGCLLAGLGLRRNVTRFERAASLVFLAALSSFPILYQVHREAFMEFVADSARDLVRSDGADAKRIVRDAVVKAQEPDTAVHTAVAEAIAQGRDPKHLAFALWSASQWSPGNPCAVQIWDLERKLLSTFDFDSPPARLLPGPPDPKRIGAATLRGLGEGERIKFYAYDFVLKTLVEERPVAIARFLLPDRWDVLLTDLRPSMFSEPLAVLGRQGSRPLLIADLALDGRVQRTSDGTTADFERPDPELVSQALRARMASGRTRYRGHDALLLLTHTKWRLGALVFPDNLLQQGGLALAKVLLVYAAICLLYGVLLLVFRRGEPVVFLFRHRVAMFLALISIAPVLLIATYDRNVTGQRYETEVAETLKRRLDLAEKLLPENVDNEWCTAFAADHRMDLNVYRGQELIATSRPGVWDTGLLARRLSSRAYLTLEVERGTDMTGSEYFTRDAGLRAAYRRVRGETDGSLILMAPALDDRRALERRFAESNALLLAIYLTTALMAVFVALYLARSLTSPVHELREATQRVAAGDLGATLREERTDEFGDLVRAFNRMTREIGEAQELRVRVEKAAAWREMARQIAHEIKNPLTPIKLTVQNLLAGYDKAGFKQDFETGAKMILEQIEALQRIAADFSAYARFPEREPKPIDLNELLDEVAALFSGSGVETATDAGDLVVEADRDELRRALINLVTNSQQAGATSISLRSEGHESVAVVTVRDDGAGIHAGDLDRIWEPSFTTKSSGTGLGMPIVKRVVEDHGGTIELDSKPGRGTTVTIRLPRAES